MVPFSGLLSADVVVEVFSGSNRGGSVSVSGSFLIVIPAVKAFDEDVDTGVSCDGEAEGSRHSSTGSIFTDALFSDFARKGRVVCAGALATVVD